MYILARSSTSCWVLRCWYDMCWQAHTIPGIILRKHTQIPFGRMPPPPTGLVSIGPFCMERTQVSNLIPKVTKQKICCTRLEDVPRSTPWNYPEKKPWKNLSNFGLLHSWNWWYHEYCQQVQTNVITHWLYLLSTAKESECVNANSFLKIIGPLCGPVVSLWVLPSIWPGQIPFLYPGDDISKNHLSM